MNLFAPLTKVDVERRLVYGTLAAEELDRSGEVLDYASSKPHFQAWSSDIAKATDGKSVGNLRAMHGKVAAGKFTDLQFDDEAKRIEAVAKVVDDTEWNKVLEGVYTGFSIGGKYGKTWDDQGHRRYEAIPAEGSLVDYPCIPSATFKVVKSDGSEEVRKFTAATEAIEAVDQLASLLDQGKLDPRELLRIAMTDLQKREFSQEKHDDPARATAVQKTDEGDAKEGAVGDKGGGDDKQGDDSGDTAAAVKTAAADALAKVGRRNSASDQGLLQDAHDALVKAGATCSKMDGGDDASQVDDDFALAAGVDELCKAAGLEPVEGDNAMEKAAQLVVSLAKAHARIKELEAMPAPTKGVLKAVTKAADMTVNQNTTDTDLEAELERAAKAQVDGDPVPMVKFIHKYGARAIRPNGPIASK
ncbi:hypothetical protein DF011_17855 [Burkholderia ubonensis]|nr:hypothetical protein CJO70_07330 [Burkholderia ubonensis]PAJ94847.1 hypothetical protein CJO69_09815 [Burkholderia ubonensis]PAK08663.1 hypothetical protein CJO67_06635 [Burkholderia ubonensis]RQP71203.1 hypothetical protein DF013_22645 [Burkholderia ubonensis]RQP82853.1 hypothetical protein DF014_18775 [Burkholderia ubonensis]